MHSGARDPQAKGNFLDVSILVLLDIAFRAETGVIQYVVTAGFNPCSSGYCIQGASLGCDVDLLQVSILVLLDIAFRD